MWESLRRPSARRVSRALANAGRLIHFTTVARWKRQGWQTINHPDHPLTAAMHMVDHAVPLLTGDPTSRAIDLETAKAPGERGRKRSH